MKRKTRRKLWNRIFKGVFLGANMHNEHPLDSAKRVRKHMGAIRKLRSYHLSHELDFRSGHDTYGYETLESIYHNLLYISDRFGAAFRLSWLINVPDEVDRLIKVGDTFIP